MQMRHPKLLTNSEQMVEQRLAFLFGLGLSDAAVKKIVQSHPQVPNHPRQPLLIPIVYHSPAPLSPPLFPPFLRPISFNRCK
jgi:hypothetical protein